MAGMTAARGATLPASRRYSLPDPTGRARVEQALRALPGWTERAEQSCAYRLDFAAGGERVIVKQYSNGTLYVQASGAGGPLFQRLIQTIEQAAGRAAPPRASPARGPDGAALSVERPFDLPWIGSDESGKGDYFGPLVACAVYVDERTLGILETLRVRDSKRLSDAQNRRLAQEVRAVCGDRRAEVVIPPDRYNALYREFRAEGKTLNSLLAWGHARAIETVLERAPCRHVIVDRFADARYLRARLEERVRANHLTIVQVPRAEANLAVAAASVLARDRFLRWLERASREIGMALPKGASPQVEAAARRLVAAHGPEILTRLAKLHFKTTERVLETALP
jgi:ribonuclease HIII